MTCPDDARLDLWLDDTLDAPGEAAAVAAHVASCPACTARRAARLAEERLWQAALALDAGELTHLARANLMAAWREAAVPAQAALWWPALVLLGVVGTWLAWLLALPMVEAVALLANRLGLVGLGLGWALGRLWDVAMAAGAAATHPALANPTLLLAAAGVLLWSFLARPWAMAPTE